MGDHITERDLVQEAGDWLRAKVPYVMDCLLAFILAAFIAFAVFGACLKVLEVVRS